MATAKPHPLQRSWDALLILHWRRDSRFGELSTHCKQMLGEYPEKLGEEGLIRCSAFAFPTTHVRVWVDTYLHPLGVKLWDIEDNKRVLDWCNASTGLDCVVNRKAKKWQRQGYDSSRRSDILAQQVEMSKDAIYGAGRRMDNPNQVKATGRGRKIKVR